MEVVVALGVPHFAILFTSVARVNLSGSSTISVGLVTIGTVVTEAFILGAVLPTDWTNTRETVLAVRVAESAILLLIRGAG